jgi:hypothetical protein
MLQNISQGLGLDTKGGKETRDLKWIFKNWDGEEWTGLIWLRVEKGGWRL